MTKDEVIEELDEMFNLGSAQERATRQGLTVVSPDDQTPLASRRLRSNAEGQRVMNLEGMTGEEVAIEEARVAARKENRRVVTEGLKETRKLLRTPEEPLASRGRLNRAKEQGR